jgi:putative NADPH-quinone reductase
MRNILVVLGHPSSQSLSNALADAYAEGARSAGHDVKMLKLGELQFDPILREGYRQIQELEADLLEAQALIRWADHLVFVYPSWWGNMPALLKGFLDRAFLPGFAFKYKGSDSPWWDRLLSGKSAHLILTMDAPRIYNWLAYGDANIRAMKDATLKYCGVKPVKTTVFDRVRFSDAAKRAKWLEKCQKMGREA